MLSVLTFLLPGESIQVGCVAIGFPIPKIRWLRNMHELKKQGAQVSWIEKRTILLKKNKVIGKIFAVLTMKPQSEDVSVGCKAYSSAGKTSARVKLRIHHPPGSQCKWTLVFLHVHIFILVISKPR